MTRLCLCMLFFLMITRFVVIGCILLFFYVKKYLSHMDETSWDTYFQSISNQGYFFRFIAIAMIASIITSMISYFLFHTLHYSHALLISAILFILNMIFIYWDSHKNKDVLIQKNRTYKNGK